VKFPLTLQLIEEAKQYELRSACCHCFFWRGDKCAHDWPDEGQRRWPLDTPDADGKTPAYAAFCKEFELR
jgi:hypothetical protein